MVEVKKHQADFAQAFAAYLKWAVNGNKADEGPRNTMLAAFGAFLTEEQIAPDAAGKLKTKMETFAGQGDPPPG